MCGLMKSGMLAGTTISSLNVIRPFPVLRVTEFEGRVFLVEVEDIGDDDTTGRTGEGMLLHVLVANLGTRDDLRIARDANDRVANCHTENSIVSRGRTQRSDGQK